MSTLILKKITALMPADLMKNLKTRTNAPTITKALIIAANDWVYRDKITDLAEKLKKRPLRFKYSAEYIRQLNRRKRW